MIDERIPTHERLPTVEMINAMEDVASLRDLQDAIFAQAKKIEVDLEFRSDDFATDDWERRARGALAAHHTCHARIGRRISYLTRGGKVPDPAKANKTKADRNAAQAALEAAQAENRREKAREEREKTVRRVADVIERQSLLTHFYRAATAHLDRATVAMLMGEARQSMHDAITAELEPLPSAHPTPLQDHRGEV